MPTYKGISSEAFRHPLDRQAEEALRNLPGFNLIARKFVEFVYERPQLVYLMGNAIQVGPRQYSTIYQMFRECVRDLDIYPEPTLFVAQNPEANSYALGQENPYILINTGILDLLDQGEIRAVLAHELGHIKCGHTILIQMAMWAMSAASALGEMTFGIGNFVSQALIYAFFEWRRKAELTADRAALLVIDDLNTVMSSMMKVSGGSIKYAHECSLQEFIKQSENYHSLDENGMNQVYKFLLYNGAQGMMLGHPFPVERLRYLQEWSVSEQYQQIRQGNYQQSPASGAVDITAQTASQEAETLRRQIEELQQQINKIKKSDNFNDNP
ncbi:M48 family metallopeptidase [Umezakia ovalisporum]|jgi:Zn-dependent protease with chaperone function|uniref:M48 family metallopeptidase n=2 Tax=Umezakia ovalisporum TaxID=75695 RepID=A0AA43KFY9_9CYAN|nr:M48 family metallopeptidase [Umezakia ovalisporum]MBI1240039.1 M48 family metalloprotease [Nostoc sp. RI_552]MDH6056951.1 M48 family metallopeptidase [Umezakia ovalisporum FSS-43]MDH6064483.1 M48 family metallopeptidase [Umezakia ovalisporum FSS-62]MDH6068401.1 M48 family metallopeptidase [Umezakia ovalisporum APH033B]MDH6071142.1 M48 family metallopeptidase [Umezakia ovalisporum CobakiLakeA]